MKLTSRRESWPISGAFSISRTTYTAADVITIELEQDGLIGRAECFSNERFGETQDSVEADLYEFSKGIPTSLDRNTLLSMMPPCAARNAIDCALWDLEANRANDSVWNILHLPRPKTITSLLTIGLDTPPEMAKRATHAAGFSTLKLKFAGDDDDRRITAIAKAVPDKRFVIDANEAWSVDHLTTYLPLMQELRVDMIEQPLPAGADEHLANIDRTVPICADESCQSSSDVSQLVGRYGMINIKLDKCGGLTEGLRLAKLARMNQLKVMIGCNTSTSLGIAPALPLCNFADLVDLDAPLFLTRDRCDGFEYNGAELSPTSNGLWADYGDPSRSLR